MAAYYVWSGAVGTGTGATWANAYTTLAAAMTSKLAGDIFYMAHDHSESVAANSNILLPANTSNSNPQKVICVNRAGSVPPVSADRRATAQLTTTGTGAIWFQGSAHFDGIIFNAATTTGGPHILLCEGSSSLWQRFDNCSLRINATSTASGIRGGSVTHLGSYIEWNNTTVSFANASQKIFASIAQLRWRNTPSAVLGTLPTILFQPGLSTGCSVECIGVDLSAVTGTIVGATLSQAGTIRFIDCKLNAAATLSAVQTGHGCAEIDFARSGASGVSYTAHRQRMSGLLTHETTIVRTGGALG